jgi:hypothetical protein
LPRHLLTSGMAHCGWHPHTLGAHGFAPPPTPWCARVLPGNPPTHTPPYPPPILQTPFPRPPHLHVQVCVTQTVVGDLTAREDRQQHRTGQSNIIAAQPGSVQRGLTAYQPALQPVHSSYFQADHNPNAQLRPSAMFVQPTPRHGCCKPPQVLD